LIKVEQAIEKNIADLQLNQLKQNKAESEKNEYRLDSLVRIEAELLTVKNRLAVGKDKLLAKINNLAPPTGTVDSYYYYCNYYYYYYY